MPPGASVTVLLSPAIMTLLFEVGMAVITAPLDAVYMAASLVDGAGSEMKDPSTTSPPPLGSLLMVWLWRTVESSERVVVVSGPATMISLPCAMAE